MRIVFEDGVCEEIGVEPLGEGHVRLLETPLASSTGARMGDVVEVAPEGSTFRFQRIVAPSVLITTEWLINAKSTESEELAVFLAQLCRLGGEWERAFGGILLVHAPLEHADEIARALPRVLNGSG